MKKDDDNRSCFLKVLCHMKFRFGERKAQFILGERGPFPPYECQMALIDFTLSNARRFYLSMGNPLGWKGLMTRKAKDYVPVNPFPPMSAKWHL